MHKPPKSVTGQRKCFDTYLSDANFQFLLCNREMLGKKEAEQISIDNVLGYAGGLAGALKEDDLITMRRHTKTRMDTGSPSPSVQSA